MKSLCVTILGLVLTSFLTSIEGFRTFQTLIPNGDHVPSPCNRSAIWPGVGHQNSGGGGPRNPFGLAFKANDLVWNETICQKDSDGDGMTNGYELGDPYCRWTVNTTASNEPTSHPGICEPLDKMECMTMNSWLTNCNPSTPFNCPAINETGVKIYDARFPVTTIPAQVTTYICYEFQFPADNVSDIIAFEPVLDNAPLVHHMLLFACRDKLPDHNVNEPYICGMEAACPSLIAAWAVGVSGQCIDRRLGFRIGPGGFRYGILQLHWNNANMMSGQTDSSGLRVYYTSNLRPNEGNILIIGQEFLAIPPNTPNVVYTGGCSSGCTKQLSQPFYISISFLHMHLLGRSGNITLYRNGTYLQTLQNIQAYDFNSPLTKNFPDPIEVIPGDQLRIVCAYDSTGKTTPTYYGEQTTDEMCYGFLAYYPASPLLSNCVQFKEIDICNDYSIMYKSCDIGTFLQLATVVPTLCSRNCTSPACLVAMNGIYATGCPSQADALLFLNYYFLPKTHSNDTTFSNCLKVVPPPKTKNHGMSRFASSFDFLLAIGLSISWFSVVYLAN